MDVHSLFSVTATCSFRPRSSSTSSTAHLIGNMSDSGSESGSNEPFRPFSASFDGRGPNYNPLSLTSVYPQYASTGIADLVDLVRNFNERNQGKEEHLRDVGVPKDFIHLLVRKYCSERKGAFVSLRPMHLRCQLQIVLDEIAKEVYDSKTR